MLNLVVHKVFFYERYSNFTCSYNKLSGEETKTKQKTCLLVRQFLFCCAEPELGIIVLTLELFALCFVVTIHEICLPVVPYISPSPRPLPRVINPTLTAVDYKLKTFFQVHMSGYVQKGWGSRRVFQVYAGQGERDSKYTTSISKLELECTGWC
jgi:hypothetical protein